MRVSRTTRSSRRSRRSPAPSSSGTRPTVRCSSPAASATCAASPTSRSCATSGSSRSSRAPTTSCARSWRSARSSRWGRSSRASATSGSATRSARSARSPSTRDTVRREIRPERVTRAHEELSPLADSVGDQVKRLRGEGEGLLRKYGKGIVDQGLAHRRYCDALSDIYAQIAVLSRVTSIFEEQGVEASGQERFIADTFCRRAARRVEGALDQVEHNDDDRQHSIATLAYKRGAYGYALLED